MESTCKICGSPTIDAGSKRGKLLERVFRLRHCSACRYSFVANPWTDYTAIYSEKYYNGEGVDPLVDYQFELEQPTRTVRHYEWRGIFAAVSSLAPPRRGTRWLDFGCGNGGLVRFLRERKVDAVGFEEGFAGGKASAAGIPILGRADLGGLPGSFDVVTAIEVLEHVEDPLATLRIVRDLLKPGGLFFCTTGNATAHRGRLSAWPYVMPEIHISFFEPVTLQRALTGAGFRPEFRGYLPGFTDIIRFKVLKNLKVRERAAWERGLPWPVLAKAADTLYGISAHPVGWAG